MASRDFLKHTVSTTEPTGSTLGDEWFNPTTNKIYKRVATNGTSVEFRELQSPLTFQASGSTVAQGSSIINFNGYTLTVDSTGAINIGVPTAAAAGSTGQIQFNNAGSLGASSSLTWTTASSTLGVTGFLTTFALSRSGNVNAPSWTTTSPIFNSAAALITDTTGSGTIAIRAGHSLLSPNFASSGAVTITDAANLYVNANVAGTNTTITNNWSIYNAGNMRVTGTLYNDAQITAVGIILRSGNFSRNTFTLGGALELSAATITDTTGTGTIATKGHLGVGQATFASSSATTVTNAANIYVSGNAVAGANTTITNTWGIFNAGNQYVGGNLHIGTVASNKLAVLGGTLTVSNTTTYAASFGNSNVTDLTIGSDGTYAYIQTWNSKPLQINNQGNNILLNPSSGSVGIGNTNPQRTLQINAATAGIRLEETSAGAKRLELFVGSDGISYIAANQSAQQLQFQTVGTTRITADASGSVGVGTTTPQYRLDVNNAVTSANSFQASFGSTYSAGFWSGIHFGYSEAANTSYRKSAIVFERQDSSARGKVHILNNGTASAATATLSDARLTITFDGNVGVGQTNPVAKFEVSGASGQLFAVTDSMTGTIFSANDSSGIPSIEVLDTGLVKLAEYGGFVTYGVNNAVSAAGTTQATATLLTRPINNVTTVAANSGVILPSAYPGMRVMVRNATVTTLRVYPGTGAQINTLGTNVQLSLETLANIEFVAFTTTQWYTVNATFA